MNLYIKIRLFVLAGCCGPLLTTGCSSLLTDPTSEQARNNVILSESGGIAARNWNDKANPKKLPDLPPVNQARGTSEEPETPVVAKEVLTIYEQFLTNQGLSMSPANAGQVARVTAAWNNKIIFAPDPIRGGELMPGILGRIYLFGTDEGVPLSTEGELVVGVWDNSAKAQGGQAKLLELWYIDRDTLKKMMKKDFMGNGYTVFLPFSKYHVELTQINVLARFNSVDGRSMMASPEILTLDHSAALQRAADKLGVRPEKELFLDKKDGKKEK